MIAIDSFVALAQSRRSLRRYTPHPVPPGLIQQVLTAGAWAPSAHNRQPWRFAVVQSDDQKHHLARSMGARLRADLQADHVPQAVIDQDVNRSYERITLAPVLIVLCLTMADMDTYPDHDRQHAERIMAVQSVAMAGQNLLLAAHSAGLGACWMCAPLFCPDVVRHALDLSPTWEAQGMITMGYPDQQRSRPRHPLTSRVVWR